MCPDLGSEAYADFKALRFDDLVPVETLYVWLSTDTSF